MKYIIFGTGEYCQRKIEYINDKKIVCFIDNNIDKQGKIFYGKKIYSVEQGLNKNYDYILILVKLYEDIVAQLIKLGVSIERILTYDKLYLFEDIPQRLIAKNGEETIEEWSKNRLGKKIFICSHDFSRTGVPVALMYLAILLQKMNYHVLMAAMDGGSLEQELSEHEIDYIDDVEAHYLKRSFSNQLVNFDIIVLGTLALSDKGQVFSTIGVNILWWIHESEQQYYNFQLPVNRGNIYYYGGGSRVLKKFKECYPKEKIRELLYYIPDIKTSDLKSDCYRSTDIRNFAVIGGFCKRKAQDILIDAINLLPDQVRNKCSFYFVGKAKGENRFLIEKMCQKYKQIHYIYEMNQNELAVFFKKINILICPSRDDPMPIVVTQAMQNGLPCIISDQVGQCEYIREMGGGLTFPSGDIVALKECLITATLWSQEELEHFSEQVKKIFDAYFSEHVMRQNIDKILCEILKAESI